MWLISLMAGQRGVQNHCWKISDATVKFCCSFMDMELILTDLFLSVSFLDKQVKEIQDDLDKLSPHTIKHTKKVRCNYSSCCKWLIDSFLDDWVWLSVVQLSPLQKGDFLCILQFLSHSPRSMAHLAWYCLCCFPLLLSSHLQQMRGGWSVFCISVASNSFFIPIPFCKELTMCSTLDCFF